MSGRASGSPLGVTQVQTAVREVGATRFGGRVLRTTIYCPLEQRYAPAHDWFMGKRDRMAFLTSTGIERVSVECNPFVGRAQVFDITVAHPRHNFVAEGVVVHNKDYVVDEPVEEIELTAAQASCLNDGYEGTYPGVYVPTTADRSEFDSALATFRNAFSADELAAYEIGGVPPFTFSLTSVEDDDERGIRIVDSAVNPGTSGAALEAFANDWVGLLNPLGASLTPTRNHCNGGEDCVYGLDQNLCDVPFTYGGIQPYLSMKTYDTTGVLRSMRSSLLPRVPMPHVDPMWPAEAMDIIDGTVVESCGSTQSVIDKEQCWIEHWTPGLYVSHVDPTDPALGVEVRVVAYDASLSDCAGGAATMAVDLHTREPIVLPRTNCDEDEQ